MPILSKKIAVKKAQALMAMNRNAMVILGRGSLVSMV